MKKAILTTLIVLLASVALSAQTQSFRNLCDKYAGVDGYVTIEMSGSMFNVINGVANDKTAGSDLMSKISNLVIIVAETDDDYVDDFGRDVETMIKEGSYTLMTTIRDGDDTVRFYMLQQGDKASEFMMVVANDEEYVVMSIIGNGLSIDEISQIASKTGNVIGFDD